jgi:hypothetical protein
MKPQTNYIFMGLCLAASSGTLTARAATIWTGPTTTFVNNAGSDPTQAVPGSTATNHVVIPINPANGSAFFRLALP